MKEIGSEFWTIDLDNFDNDLNFLNIGKDYKLLMSGRTAIDYVLNEIDDNKKIVYMPDYCCESMVQPFIDNNYKVEFYKVDVINNNYSINIDYDCSVFFAMSYFGYSKSNMDNYIKEFSKRNVTIIEDITHRLLCDNNHSSYSDYLICSLRKWFPVLSGGIAINVKDSFKNNLNNYSVNNYYLNLKKRAMDLKKDYMNSNIDAKDEFLELFKESNELVSNYQNKKIDDVSLKILKHLNIEQIRKSRINNCLLIEKLLCDNSHIHLIYKYENGDCPLFIPVFLNNRDVIRKELILNDVYLPVHWPNDVNSDNEIYDTELSLICDQRYSEDDIKKYISKLIEIVGD